MVAIQFTRDSAKPLEYNVMNAKLNTWARFRETRRMSFPQHAAFCGEREECLGYGEVHSSTLAYLFFLLN